MIEARQRLAPLGVPLIASIFGGTVAEYAEVARIVARAAPDAIEVNISCPNVADEFGTPFAASCASAADVTAAVKAAAHREERIPGREKARMLPNRRDRMRQRRLRVWPRRRRSGMLPGIWLKKVTMPPRKRLTR